MKLILSSCDFTNPNPRKAIYDNLNKPIQECKVLFFPNEKATKEKIVSGKYHKRLSEYGFLSKNIYVFNYFESGDFDYNDVDIIYVGGGNTFETLNLIRKSNMDKFIIERVKKGTIYIGGSASAHIVSQDIEHVSRYDENKSNIINFDGLKLFDGIFICHYNKDRENHYKSLLMENKYEVYAMTDEEFIVVNK
ncbi:MAG: Type 1 glutamine amidotransferase-like domain-containing protein [Clostridia bacterium]|nr:Type 1 glutamine amidotransferase-like domain-containing protein [Clostridia bacterium]